MARSQSSSSLSSPSSSSSLLPFSREAIQPGDRLCVAVSGGADSVALLLLLHAANSVPRDSLGVGLSAVHVHHGLRGAEADADQAFVADLCRRLGVPLHVHAVSVPEHAAATGETIEEAARTLRYQIFHELLGSGAADAILTGHTLDDQAETVLMKLLRGAWTEGLSGIHPVVTVALPNSGRTDSGRTGRILRPLLALERRQIEGYLRAAGQEWRTDSSNADPAYTRNRIRHSILPLLREENPSLDQTLGNMAELAREEEARWQAELARLLPQLLLPGKPVRGGGRSVSTAPSTAPGAQAISIEIDRLRTLDPALRRRVLRAAARQVGARLSFEETARLLALAGFAPHPTVTPRNGATLELAQGLRAERSLRELRLSREAV
ncbi:MAG TPA: tRNA lysidine(34) synthetase TilS [Granulicella sp.]|nr:tRNA lysidine(34) synthetase TilS [Granulicella sp.]